MNTKTTKQIAAEKIQAAGLTIHLLDMRSRYAHVGIGQDIRCIKTDRLLEGRDAAEVFSKARTVDQTLVRRYSA